MSERIPAELVRELADISGKLGGEIERLERVDARLATAVLSEVVKEDA